jgi:hypothetical protein
MIIEVNDFSTFKMMHTIPVTKNNEQALGIKCSIPLLDMIHVNVLEKMNDVKYFNFTIHTFHITQKLVADQGKSMVAYFCPLHAR